MSTFPSRRLTSIPPRLVHEHLHALDWDERVAREAEHQALIEAAFDRVDEYERLGDFENALEWLSRADALSGGLPPAYCAKRARSVREVARRRIPGP